MIDGQQVEAWDSLKMTTSFSDNLELSEAFFEIHENFAGHSHQKANLRHSDSKIVELTDKQDQVEVSFFIPGNAASGPYHMEVSALDVSGNRSEVKVFKFDILQSTQPIFVSLPPTIKTPIGSTFNIRFQVTDETDLKEITYEIIQPGREGYPPIFDGDIDLDGTDDKSFSFDQDFSASGSQGMLLFIVRAFDSDGNLSVAEIDIIVE